MKSKHIHPNHVRAAVITEKGAAFQFRMLTLDKPRADEVLVKIVATGLCHTDLAARDQILGNPLPAVVGHEGAGVIEAIGKQVTGLTVGDHVVLTFLSCSSCYSCQTGSPAGCENFGELNFSGARSDATHCLHDHVSDRFFGQSSFATYAIAHQRNVVKVRKDVPLELLGPLGCGIQTGAGTVLNALDIEAGSSIAVFGAGAVGLSAVMAARVAGATLIIAIDVVPSRLDLAKELGATHVINSRDTEIVSTIKDITNGRGVDYAMDSTGRVEIIRQAVTALRAGGACAIVGTSKPNAELTLDVNDLLSQRKSIRGVIEGESIPHIFIPRLIELYLQGRFPFDKLIKFYDFDQINTAVDDSEKGLTLKPVIRIDSLFR